MVEELEKILAVDQLLRERITHYKSLEKQHNYNIDLLDKLERQYVVKVLGPLHDGKYLKESADALKWFGEYNRWIK